MTELGKTRQIVATVCIALVHLVATVALLFASFRGKRFDRGIPRSLIEEVQGGYFMYSCFHLSTILSLIFSQTFPAHWVI